MSEHEDVLVLTLYPLSSDYKSRLEATSDRQLTYVLVSELRHLSIIGLLRHLLVRRWRRVIVPYEVPEAAGVISIVQLVAAAHGFPGVEVCNPSGDIRKVGYTEIILGGIQLCAASIEGFFSRLNSRRAARRLLKTTRARRPTGGGRQRILYLKNNLWFGLRAGGSVGHVAGVINGFVNLGHEVCFISPEAPKYLSTKTISKQVPLFAHFALPPVSNCCRIQSRSVRAATRIAKTFKPTLIYQRLSMGDWSGAELAESLGLPLIVEYNGSEVWVARNWGGRKSIAGDMQMLEEAVLRRADLIFAISRPLYDELILRGFDASRVAWYPNCVDPNIYDASAISEADRNRAREVLRSPPKSFVVMFVGTFGLWHGAEVFAKAAAMLAEDREWIERQDVRFAFVGDGKTRERCEEIIKASVAIERTVFTGLVPQHAAPAYLAAADSFVASHIPNADGSKFFGSPTKIFEYMSMGRPIVASALDQIAEVLADGKTAILVEPGSIDALVEGIRRLVDDRGSSARLGAAARREALMKYTWERHVSEILNAVAR